MPFTPRFGMLARLALCAAAFASLTGWMLWGRHAEPAPSGQLPAQVVYAWGVVGVQPGELNFPRAIKAVEDGTLFVIDRSGRCQHFSREGKYLGDWRFPAWQNGTPTSISLDPDGHLIIANTHYSEILIYDQKGKLLRRFGEKGEGVGRMKMPTDARMGPDHCIYVLERLPWRDKVMKFTAEGKFISEWGASGDAPGQFVRPMAVEFDRAGRVWIADSCNHRLEAFDPNGKFIKSIGRRGSALGEMDYPYDMALGPNEEFVVAEYGNNRIQVFDKDGRALGVFGRAGKAPGQFASPWGVDVDKDGIIWVADTLNNRVQGIKIAWSK